MTDEKIASVKRTNVIVEKGWKHRGKIGWIYGGVLGRGSLATKARVHLYVASGNRPVTIDVAFTQMRALSKAEMLLLKNPRDTGIEYFED